MLVLMGRGLSGRIVGRVLRVRAENVLEVVVVLAAAAGRSGRVEHYRRWKAAEQGILGRRFARQRDIENMVG